MPLQMTGSRVKLAVEHTDLLDVEAFGFDDGILIARLLGGFAVGDGAKIGSNAVVIKPVPAGATAVGIPARIIPSKEGQSADVTEPQQARKFTAYGITQEDDPLSQAMRGLIDNASSQEHQIALLWQAIEKLSANPQNKDCVPCDAAIKEQFEAGKLNELVGK